MVAITDESVKISLVGKLLIFITYVVAIVIGLIYDALDEVSLRIKGVKTRPNLAPLTSDFESFYTRRLYARLADCWNRPIASAPGPIVCVMERKTLDPLFNTKFALTGKVVKCLNLASYNYLGFAESSNEIINTVIQSVKRYGISSCSPRAEAGAQPVHEELERTVAEFVGHEAALVFAMGFATNSTTIPALASKDDLIMSDSLNHASLVAGCRSSGAKIKTFKHNNMVDLESKIRTSIAARRKRPFGKILIIVEGIYSMEGEVCNLPRLVELKKKYKCYLYVDEAHSIGALGKSGRGVCEYWGIDPHDVDILMGTFTKSFSSVGGYICGSQQLIDTLRTASFGQVYDCAICPGAAQQTISAMKLMQSKPGKELVSKLHENSNFFRTALLERGYHACGDKDSPVVPVLLYYPAKMVEFSREALRKGIAAVVVGFPATSLFSNRIRFCISAAHTRKQLEWAIQIIDKLGKAFFFRYERPYLNPSPAQQHEPVASTPVN